MLRALASICLLCLGLSWGAAVSAASATVAVASNFKATLAQIQPEFERQTGHSLKLVSASSGVLYQQVRAGAPFDVFLSADAERPMLLAESGHGVATSRHTYALGQLALAGQRLEPTQSIGQQLKALKGKLALANPRLAPYGQAAQQTLEHLSMAEPLSQQQVLGANVLQAYQFVTTGNAELGIIALPLLKQDPKAPAHLPIPSDWHQPIAQQSIVLARGQHNAAAIALIDYLQQPVAQATMVRNGYLTPEATR